MTVYGRVLVCNTLMMQKVLYRARVNSLSKKIRKQMVEAVKTFVWKEVRPLKWKIAVRGVSEGGIGVKDPNCMIDAMRIKLIRDMKNKTEQPWVTWLKRKEDRLKNRWGVTTVWDGVTRRQLRELGEECLFEEAVRVWHEMRGEESEGRMRVKIGEEWRELEKLRGREVYEQLVRIRWGELKEEEKNRVNYTMTRIHKLLTPRQRQFWWKIAHKKVMTNNCVHKWLVRGGERAGSECRV